MTTRISAADAAPLLVACLCARWCRLCGDYRTVFDAAAAADCSGARYRWVDIEDDEDLVGPVDVDDFPTILISRGAHVLFFGPLTPQPATLARLIDRARVDALGRVDAADVMGLAERVSKAPGVGAAR